MLYARSVEEYADATAFAQKSPPRASFVPSDELSQKGDEAEPRALGSVPIGTLVEKLSLAGAQQAELVAQLKASCSGESSCLAQKDGEIILLRAQLASARVEVESTTAYSRRLVDERLALLAEVKRERAATEQYRTNCAWGLKYLQENRGRHFKQLDKFHKFVETALETQESKLRKLSLEYDEELYPHLVSAVAERRYLFLISLLFALNSFVIF